MRNGLLWDNSCRFINLALCWTHETKELKENEKFSLVGTIFFHLRLEATDLLSVCIASQYREMEVDCSKT